MPRPFIAVVDDDPSVTKSLARRLRLAGYAVRAFGSAREFLDSLDGVTPRCLVADVQMPEMSGFELALRLQERGHPVPVIFITAHDTPQVRAAAGECQAVALLFKPFDTAALLGAIKASLDPRG